MIHAASTWFMVGVIWYVQVVHYPLFAKVGRGPFPGYEAENIRRTAIVVVPVMSLELGSAVWLWKEAPSAITGVGLALLLFLWASSALAQGVLHARLTRGFRRSVWFTLLGSNWARTAAWSLRGLLVCALLGGAFENAPLAFTATFAAGSA